MTGFFANIFSTGASTLVEAIGDAIDKNITSDEEKKALENELAKAQIQYELDKAALGLKTVEAYLGDIDSARDNQSRVQESEHSSWLAKNIHPLLSIAIIGLTFWLYWLIIFTDGNLLDGNKKDIVIYILGALTTVSTQVASYFFGSSQGSADKNKTIMDFANAKNN